jgi:hypothetical protein
MFDNRKDKAGPKAPDFRCRDVDCIDPATGKRTALWARDLVKQGSKAATTAAPAPVAPTFDRDLAALHFRCLEHVIKHEAPLLAPLGGDTAGAVSALTAQLFAALASPGSR